MNMRENKDKNGALLTIPQIAEQANMGVNTVRRLAIEAGALVKIGKLARIDPEVFFDYVKREYKVG